MQALLNVQSLVRNRIVHPQYESLVFKLLNSEPLPQDQVFGEP